MLRLFCYVRGDHYKKAFPVKIEEDEDVAALKENIKEKAGQTFRDIDNKSLVLWKASVTYNKNLKENVERLDLDYDKSLEPLDTLSGIFSSELEKRSIHIVVDRPPLGEFSYATRVQSNLHDFNSSSHNSIRTTAPRTQLSGFWRQSQSRLSCRNFSFKDRRCPQESHQERKEACIRAHRRRRSHSLEGRRHHHRSISQRESQEH
jgi:Crinkler effector protein N-terminal domain